MRRAPKQAWGIPREKPFSRKSSDRGRSSFNARDIEDLRHNWATQRKDNVQLRKENRELTLTVDRLTDLLRRKDISMHRVLKIKVDKSEQSVNGKKYSNKLKAVRNDMVSVSKLSNRIRELEYTLAQKTRELELVKEMIQNTKISELKMNLKTNYTRTRKLSKILSRLAEKLKLDTDQHEKRDDRQRDIADQGRDI
mmetsp:Transcript_25722/g.35826  ORF Transcript_25722/g.35826 Transcript_25722/m.35826 type:complete len:196 (+) Transcript_25722:114-701(+)|eukprot:CAMPEP_0184501338 /NCGR_PEP_ID=MMETSP0113_2-20130426/47410_1 /TAXON_ID=91329 /ORGANISM="Norrisiella sphaerica, Strain BC52" /LENGTH=195 /DNA_ID=CAMNT_0026890067 /DNA_START=108 /DNA_END=695 /DNA_ORIENTATION=+